MTKNISERELSKMAGGVDVQVTDTNTTVKPTGGIPTEPGDPNLPDIFSADAESGSSSGSTDLAQRR